MKPTNVLYHFQHRLPHLNKNLYSLIYKRICVLIYVSQFIRCFDPSEFRPFGVWTIRCFDPVVIWPVTAGWPYTSMDRATHLMMTSSNGNIFRVTGQWRGALMFTLICVWINGCVNNREAGDLRRYCVHYGVTVMPLEAVDRGGARVVRASSIISLASLLALHIRQLFVYVHVNHVCAMCISCGE